MSILNVIVSVVCVICVLQQNTTNWIMAALSLLLYSKGLGATGVKDV
jgi:hypothetical protein